MSVEMALALYLILVGTLIAFGWWCYERWWNKVGNPELRKQPGAAEEER